MAKLKAKIFNSTDKGMKGAELKRLRDTAGLTQEQLAEKMGGWGWYREKVIHFEDNEEFYLNPREMQALLDVLGASPI